MNTLFGVIIYSCYSTQDTEESILYPKNSMMVHHRFEYLIKK